MTKMNRSDQEFRPAKRSLGQNFLIDQNYVNRIVAALDLEDADTVIEIGPGRGAITELLVESGASVIAIELDRDLVPMLRERFAANENFSVIEADATHVDFQELLPKNQQSVKLVANLPYYISTPILRHLSTQRHLFGSLVLMFQKEVVDRISAAPGDSDRGYLTVLTEIAFEVERLFDVPPNAFRPVPKVTSTVARLIPKSKLNIDESALEELISASFAQKRKTILNNLKARYADADKIIERSGVDSGRRAESLTLDEWLLLLGGLEDSR